jgi:hypothetical protein
MVEFDGSAWPIDVATSWFEVVYARQTIKLSEARQQATAYSVIGHRDGVAGVILTDVSRDRICRHIATDGCRTGINFCVCVYSPRDPTPLTKPLLAMLRFVWIRAVLQ